MSAGAAAGAAAAAIAAAPRLSLKAATYLLLPILSLLCDCGVSAAAAAAAEAAVSLRGDSSTSLTPLQQQQQQQQHQQQEYQPVVSDDLLLELLRRAEIIRRGPPGAPAGGWEVLAEHADSVVYRRRREGASDYEYAMRGYFSDLSAAAYLTALNSIPLRTAWDKTAKDVRLLKVTQLPPPAAAAAAAEDKSSNSSSSSTRRGEASAVDSQREVGGKGAPQDEGPPTVHAVGGPEYEEIIYWRVGLPWPAQDRDFVFARRLRAYRRSNSNSNSSSSRSSSSSSSSSRDVYALVCGQLQLDTPEMPETKEAVRIAFFEAAVVAFPENQIGDRKRDSLSLSDNSQASSHHKASLGSSLGSSLPTGGDPQRNGVTYIALHYDRSNEERPLLLSSKDLPLQQPEAAADAATADAAAAAAHADAAAAAAKDSVCDWFVCCRSPVPSWLRSYVATQSLPATMRLLRSTALLWLSPSGRAKDVGALRGPQGAPFTQDELLLLEQQYNIHSVQWGGGPEGPPPSSLLEGAPQDSLHLSGPQQQQQQHEARDVAAGARALDSAAAAAAGAAAAAAELRQLLEGARGDTEASCASRPVPVPLILGGPHELIRGAPPFISAVDLISKAIGGAPWWGPLKRVTVSPHWGPSQAAGEALKWALRLLGPPCVGPPCACTDISSGGPPSGSRLAYKRRGLLSIFGLGPRGAPCPFSKATGLPCGHSSLRGLFSRGASISIVYRRP
ncbi:hypothetical protein Emag_001158 [Eimeria magna]